MISKGEENTNFDTGFYEAKDLDLMLWNELCERDEQSNLESHLPMVSHSIPTDMFIY